MGSTPTKCTRYKATCFALNGERADVARLRLIWPTLTPDLESYRSALEQIFGISRWSTCPVGDLSALKYVKRTFRPDIEGLRAIAVGLVLLDHAGWKLARGGYIGVDVFFVLSGFLITGILFRELERSGTISLRAFYARRARRLLPAGTLVLLVTVITSYLWIGGTRADRIAVDAQWTAVFLANFRFISQGTDYLNSTLPPSPVQHYWSLAVEEQFYLVWPLLLMGVATVRRGKSLRAFCVAALAVVTLGSLALSIIQTPSNGTVAYFSPFTRAWELGLGGLVALGMPWIRRLPGSMAIPLGWIGVGAIGFAAVQFGPATVFPGSAALIPVVGTVLVVVAGSVKADIGVERCCGLRQCNSWDAFRTRSIFGTGRSWSWSPRGCSGI